MKKIRVEVVLTEADIDIIEFIESNTTPRATQFKIAMRAFMKQQEEERFDVRVKRLLNEVMAERGDAPFKSEKVESKSRVAFGAKRV